MNRSSVQPKSRRVVILRSNPVDPDPRVQKLAEALGGAGYSVWIVAWERTGLRPAQEQLPGGGVIYRLHIRARFGRSLMNLPAMLRWQLGLSLWLWRRRSEYEIIHACDFDTILPALLCGRLWGKRVVYDIFDFYAAMLRATPGWIKRLIRAVDLWAIGRADWVILADDCRVEQIEGSAPKRITIVYNSPQDWGREPRGVHAAPPAADRFRIAFIGLLQFERGLLELLAVMARQPTWHLDLAGFGGDELMIRRKAGRLANVRLLGRIPYSQALALSAKADALVATYDPANANHRYASPNKLFEAMMLAKPIVAAEGTNMDRIVREVGCGLVVPYGTPEALEGALLQLASNPSLRTALGSAGRRAYENRFGWAIMQQRLLDVYASLIQ